MKIHMRIKKLLLIMLACILVVTLFSCSYEFWRKNILDSIDYSATLKCEFQYYSDIKTLESIFDVLNIEIQEVNTNGNKLEYKVKSHYYLSDEVVSLIGPDYTSAIVDIDRNTLFTAENIKGVNYDGIALNVYVDEAFINTYDEWLMIQTDIKVEDTVYEVFPYVREIDSTKYLEYIEADGTEKLDLIRCAIGLSGYTFSGKVMLEVVRNDS